jgi:hypothetical protein
MATPPRRPRPDTIDPETDDGPLAAPAAGQVSQAAPVPHEAVMGAAEEGDPEELIWVEAVSDGTYPDFEDPRRESYYALYRTGRVLNEQTNTFMPGEMFKMRRRDAQSAVVQRGGIGWVRILKPGEQPSAIEQERPVPATTAPRGYGNGRRPGRLF